MHSTPLGPRIWSCIRMRLAKPGLRIAATPFIRELQLPEQRPWIVIQDRDDYAWTRPHFQREISNEAVSRLRKSRQDKRRSIKTKQKQKENHPHKSKKSVTKSQRDSGKTTHVTNQIKLKNQIETHSISLQQTADEISDRGRRKGLGDR